MKLPQNNDAGQLRFKINQLKKLKYTACHLLMALTREIHLDITFAECSVV